VDRGGNKFSKTDKFKLFEPTVPGPG